MCAHYFVKVELLFVKCAGCIHNKFLDGFYFGLHIPHFS